MKPYELTEEEIEHIDATTLADNPHWEPDAWGLFGVMAHAAQKKMLGWLKEPCNEHFTAKALKAKMGLCLRRHCCPQCIAQLLKDFGLWH